MTDTDELLDISQAAHFLRVSETSLRRWTNAGQLACLRVGLRRERRFRRRELIEFMELQPGIHSAATSGPGSSARGSAVVDGRDLAHGTHFCGLYSTDRARVQLSIGFLAGGLRAGSASFLVAKSSVRRGLLDHLKRERPSLKADIDAGRLVVSDNGKSCEAQIRYFQDSFDFALSSGVRSFRVVGDMSGLAGRMSLDELGDYESAYSELIAAKYPVVTLCQYDARVFSSVAILNALRGHPDSLNPAGARWLA